MSTSSKLRDNEYFANLVFFVGVHVVVGIVLYGVAHLAMWLAPIIGNGLTILLLFVVVPFLIYNGPGIWYDISIRRQIKQHRRN